MARTNIAYRTSGFKGLAYNWSLVSFRVFGPAKLHRDTIYRSSECGHGNVSNVHMSTHQVPLGRVVEVVAH